MLWSFLLYVLFLFIIVVTIIYLAIYIIRRYIKKDTNLGCLYFLTCMSILSFFMYRCSSNNHKKVYFEAIDILKEGGYLIADGISIPMDSCEYCINKKDQYLLGDYKYSIIGEKFAEDSLNSILFESSSVAT